MTALRPILTRPTKSTPRALRADLSHILCLRSARRARGVLLPISSILTFLAVIFFLSKPVIAADPPSEGTSYLTAVSKGQVPNDTGSDGGTKMSIEKLAELGGDALKVVFAPEDSFSDRTSKVKNWKQFTTLRFEVFNPSTKITGLKLNVNHRRTTSFNTRVVVPITVKPGKNTILIGIDDMVNSNGTAPDLANVLKWFISSDSNKETTLFFSDIRLEGGEAALAPGNPLTAPATPAGGSSAGYRVHGKIGDQKVDLIVTPILSPSAPQGSQPDSSNGEAIPHRRIHADKIPTFDRVIALDTPEADAVLSALEIFPPDNPWNLDIAKWPLHPNSRAIVASIGSEKIFRVNYDMACIIVPANQKLVPVKVTEYPAESEKGPFPIPDSMPIEGWPSAYQNSPKHKGLTLDDIQRNKLKEEGDRHAIVVDAANRMLYEFWVTRKTDAGWEAAQASVFDLKTNKLRPDGWTSADAAGLPIFPAVVRYDELKRGIVDHAMRVTVPRSDKEYVYPATHHAGHALDANLPRMGERLRLRQDFDITGFSPDSQAILKGLKQYGMLVADNGISWAISVAPDPRIPDLSPEMRKLKGSDFEVIQAPRGYRPPTDH